MITVMNAKKHKLKIEKVQDYSTRESIIEISSSSFFKYGIHKVSMNDIAEKCGISKKTIYNYYESKHQLVEAILNYNIDEFEEHIKSIQEKSANANKELVLLFEYLIELYKEILPIFINDLKKSSINIYIERSKFLLYSFLLNNYERGLNEQIYKERDSIKNDIQVVVRIIQMLFSERNNEQSTKDCADIFFIREMLISYLSSRNVTQYISNESG